MTVIGTRWRAPGAMESASWADSSVEVAVEALSAGDMVIVVDAENPDDDGDLMLAAAHVTPQRLAFMMRHTGGILCVPMPAADLDLSLIHI